MNVPAGAYPPFTIRLTSPSYSSSSSPAASASQSPTSEQGKSRSACVSLYTVYETESIRNDNGAYFLTERDRFVLRRKRRASVQKSLIRGNENRIRGNSVRGFVGKIIRPISTRDNLKISSRLI